LRAHAKVPAVERREVTRAHLEIDAVPATADDISADLLGRSFVSRVWLIRSMEHFHRFLQMCECVDHVCIALLFGYYRSYYRAI